MVTLVERVATAAAAAECEFGRLQHEVHSLRKEPLK